MSRSVPLSIYQAIPPFSYFPLKKNERYNLTGGRRTSKWDIRKNEQFNVNKHHDHQPSQEEIYIIERDKGGERESESEQEGTSGRFRWGWTVLSLGLYTSRLERGVCVRYRAGAYLFDGVCVSVWVWMCGRYDTRGSEPISKEPPPNPSTTRPSAWGRVWWTGEAHERFILVESLETCTIC